TAAAFVRWGFAVQVLAAALLAFTGALPAADPAVQDAYDRILGTNWMFAFSSLAAYAASQSLDVFAFHGIRDAVLARHPGGYGRRWIWNNASTMSAQLVDTVVFVGLAFGVGLGWLSDPAKRPALFQLMLGQYAVKVALAALDTPLFFLLTSRRKNAAEG
ncbi:MAG: queuosine precursor transporter, partial [Kiritimatiellae bacterium]|nr:queuosine precursor transporter [Kiritimatiellia bacterium]